MLNKVTLIGRLGDAPTTRATTGGTPVGNFSVATESSYKDREGNWQKKTEWHRVVCFGKLAENVEKYLGKGSLVYVEGSLQTRKWKDRSDHEQTTTEVVADEVKFLDPKKKQDGDSHDQRRPQEEAF